MKITKRQLQRIIKEEIKVIREEEKVWSEGLEGVLDYLGYNAEQGGPPWKSSPLALLGDYTDVNITPSEDDYDGSITITWARKQVSRDVIDAEDMYDQGALPEEIVRKYQSSQEE